MSDALAKVKQIGDAVRDLEAIAAIEKAKEDAAKGERLRLAREIDDLRDRQVPLLKQADQEGVQRVEIQAAAAMGRTALWKILGPKAETRPMRR